MHALCDDLQRSVAHAVLVLVLLVQSLYVFEVVLVALADLTLGVPLGLERLSKDSGDGEIIGNARAEPSQPEHEGDACFL